MHSVMGPADKRGRDPCKGQPRVARQAAQPRALGRSPFGAGEGDSPRLRLSENSWRRLPLDTRRSTGGATAWNAGPSPLDSTAGMVSVLCAGSPKLREKHPKLVEPRACWACAELDAPLRADFGAWHKLAWGGVAGIALGAMQSHLAQKETGPNIAVMAGTVGNLSVAERRRARHRGDLE